MHRLIGKSNVKKVVTAANDLGTEGDIVVIRISLYNTKIVTFL